MSSIRAVVLLSGGIDSSTVLAAAKAEKHLITAVTFDYGQRHRFELEAAMKVAAHLCIQDHTIIRMDLRQIGGSALTGDIEVPKRRSESEIGVGIPVTYVPVRNMIFLSYAVALAEVRNVSKIYIGANAVDYSGYPDCRPEFIKSFEQTANLATKAGVEGRRVSIEAPLINLSKAEIIKLGTKLGLDYSLTISCYDPSGTGRACGMCDSCLLRKKGFAEAGIEDPTPYVKHVGT